VTDVLLEPRSRKGQGGLPPADYLIPIVLSVLVGALLCSVFSATWGDWARPTQVQLAPTHFWPTTLMAIGAVAVSLLELLTLWEQTLFATWAWGIAVAALGLLVPGALYDPVANHTGPLFLPVFVLSLGATIVCNLWMAKHTLAASGVDRKRRLALFGANVLGAVGGGGIIMLRILELAPMELASPLLLGSVLLASYAVLTGEKGRHREVLVQGLAFALATAAFSAVGLTVFFALMNFLVPEQLAALGKVASVVAHEIRNPLSVILAQARLLEREGASADRLKDVRDQVQRASRFVDELLRYSKPRTLALTNVELRAAHQQAIDHVQQAQSVAFLSLLPGEAVTIEADAQAVTDTAIVLLSNAAIAAAEQAVPQETIAIEAHPDEVWVRVEDHGPGVPAELEGRLFQMFVTGRGRDHKHPGTGLGLAMASRCRSSSPKGSSATISTGAFAASSSSCRGWSTGRATSACSPNTSSPAARRSCPVTASRSCRRGRCAGWKITAGLVMAAGRDEILEEDLSPALRDRSAPTAGALSTLDEKIAALEQAEIRRALTETDGNKSRAAEVLGLSRQGLVNKLARFGLK